MTNALAHFCRSSSLRETLKHMANFANATGKPQAIFFENIKMVLDPKNESYAKFFRGSSDLSGVYLFSPYTNEYEELCFKNDKYSSVTVLQECYRCAVILRMTAYEENWQKFSDIYAGYQDKGERISAFVRSFAGLVENDMQNQGSFDFLDEIFEKNIESPLNLYDLDMAGFVSALFLALKTWIYGEKFFQWGMLREFPGESISYEDLRLMNPDMLILKFIEMKLESMDKSK